MKKYMQNNTMNLFKNNRTVSFVLALVVLNFVFLCSAYGIYASSFMDLEYSIKELELVVEKVSSGVVVVVAYDSSGKESGRGVGFFIDLEGRIITNEYILKDAYSAEVISRSNHYEDITVLNRDASLDFALIQVDGTDEVPLELDFEHKMKLGERVVVVGRSADFKKTVSEGLVSSLSGEEALGLVEIQTLDPILSFRKSREGPLLNMSGNVIGVTRAALIESGNSDEIPRMRDYQHIQAVDLGAVKSLLSESGTAERLHSAKSIIRSHWLMRWLRTGAVGAFIVLYGIGFPKLLVIVFIGILIISAIQWLYFKFKKNAAGK